MGSPVSKLSSDSEEKPTRTSQRRRGSRAERKKQKRWERWQRNRASLGLVGVFLCVHFALMAAFHEFTLSPYPNNQGPYQSSLGLRFLPIDNHSFLFAEFPVRRSDFKIFAQETSHHPGTNSMIAFVEGHGWMRQPDLSWENPGFPQEENHPVVGVSLLDAEAFAQWLTNRERTMGRIHAKQFFRLPTDYEWSLAAGLREPRQRSPKELNGSRTHPFPWGLSWPPPPEVGNLAGQEWNERDHAKIPLVPGYDDGYHFTSPVGSFPPNAFGLYDMTGNVWEWTSSPFEPNSPDRSVRGSSWWNGTPDLVHPSARHHFPSRRRVDILGFRLVLDISAPIE